jgi:vancomycin resistance protein YoaR
MPGGAGRDLDAAALARTVKTTLNQTRLRAAIAVSLTAQPDRAEWLKAQTPIEITATLRPSEGRVTAKHLEGITATLATFSTSLGSSSSNRVQNVRLACRAIDGLVLLPGDVFSYNNVVGPRVPRAGYREAPVIVRGKLQPGIGGGICQVSSTLYNAVLLADLEIVRRQHHSFPVSYLPAGRDATVSYGSIDFRFRNSLPHPIALDAKVVGRRVVFQVHGHRDDRKEVRIVQSNQSSVKAGATTVTDPRLPRGRRVVDSAAKPGRRVTVARIVSQDGKVIRRDVVSRDYYRPFPTVIRVGTGGASSRRRSTDRDGGDRETSGSTRVRRISSEDR